MDREARDREEKAVNDRDLVYWTEVLGKATVFLAFATVVLMVFTGLHLLILKGQGRDLEKQRSVMQRQAEHLGEQAVQLKASVAQIKDTAEHQLRAYVTVRTGRIWHEMRAFGWHLEWAPVIINVGQTPAYNVQLCVKTAIRPEPLPDGTDLMAEVPLTGVGSRPSEPRRRGVGIVSGRLELRPVRLCSTSTRRALVRRRATPRRSGIGTCRSRSPTSPSANGTSARSRFA